MVEWVASVIPQHPPTLPAAIWCTEDGRTYVEWEGHAVPCRPGRRATDPPGSWVTPQGLVFCPDPRTVAHPTVS